MRVAWWDLAAHQYETTMLTKTQHKTKHNQTNRSTLPSVQDINKVLIWSFTVMVL